jgi:hypothetical protein
MRRFLAAAMAGGLALLGAGAAQAQQPGDSGIDCVYEALFDEYELVAEAFLFNDMADDDRARATQIIDAAKKSCATQYRYAHGQIEAVGELGVYGLSLDYLSEELMASGASEEAVGGLFDAYDAFTDEDVDMFFDTAWRSDAVFYARMKSKIIGAGVPDNDETMDIAMGMLGIMALAEESTFLFMLDQAVADTQAKP